MGHSHSLSHDGRHEDWIDRDRERAAMRVVTAIVVPLALVLAGVVASTWPHDYRASLPLLGSQSGAEFISAVVTRVSGYECVATGEPNAIPVAGGNSCATVTAAPSGEDRLGTEVTFDADPALMRQGIDTGTHVILAAITTEGTTTYVFQDFNRGNSVPLAIAALVIVVAAVGRWQGVRALLGLVVGIAIVAGYAVPLLAGGIDVVSLVVVTLPLLTIALLYGAHGYSLKTTAAIAGTLLSTGVALAGALLAIKGMHLTGMSSEDDQLLVDNLPAISLRDLLAVALVVSGFGALNDVTVTQASAVWELSASDHGRRGSRTFASAMRIGRDHIASSIYTVAFAYAGSSLATLMLIMLSNMPTSVLINSELLADEIAFLVVGLVALVLSMPITTWIAAAFASRIKADAVLD